MHRFEIKNSTKILIIGWLLIVFGIFALYSISIYESFDQTLRRAQVGKRSGDPSNFFYFNKQISNIIKALVVVGIAYFIPIKRIKDQRIIYVIGIGAILLQLLVFTSLGIDLNGARGWLYIPGLGNMQPAEFFKLWFVVFFAWWLIRKAHFFRDRTLYVAMAVMLGLMGLLFLAIPDLWSMLVIAIVAVIMAIYAGAKIKYLLMIAGGGIVMALTTIAIIPERFGYITDRLITYTNTTKALEDKQGSYYQTYNGLVAIGWWGFWWQWYGKGLQKFGNIPEAQSDFIFAALSEEIGLIGNLFIIALYMLLWWYSVIAISSMRDQYSKIFGIGLISLILVQAFVNIGVNIAILPNTGITLPFISYGGTALMVNMLEIILLYKLIERK